MKINFNFPSRPVPIDQFDGLLKLRRQAVRQQIPLDRLDALGRACFARHDAGDSDASSLAIGYLDRAGPPLLAHRARRLLVACRQLKVISPMGAPALV